MTLRLKFRCDRVRGNNGIVEVLFTRIDGEQDEHVLINVLSKGEQYLVGQYYFISIEAAFPQSVPQEDAKHGKTNRRSR